MILRRLLLVLLLKSAPVFGIDIPCDRTAQEKIDRAQVIVVGEIVSYTLNSHGVGDIVFRVLRQWNGNPLSEIAIHASARWPFYIGESGYYLIYANWATHTETPFWQVPWCQRISDVKYTLVKN